MKKTWAKVAHGNQRDVFCAEFDRRKVVIKTLNGKHKSKKFKEAIHLEAIALSLLRNATNIVQLEGICHSDMAVEWLPVDLEKLPHHELNENQRILIAMSMAEGLAQLHAIPHGPFLHHDLRLRQWMLNSEGVVKLGDLNAGWFLQRNNQGKLRIKKGRRQTGSWRAPEEYLDLPLSEKADIYVLGLSIWALLAGGKKTLYTPDQLAGRTIPEFVTGGGQPLLTDGKAGKWPVQVRDVLQRCWAEQPALRPTAAQVAAVFQVIVKERGLGDSDRYRPSPAVAI